MTQEEGKAKGPDLTLGIALDELPDGAKLSGHVGGDEVLLVRRGPTIYAIGAHCTHYHGPLAEGLVVGETVRCPWHHAAFDLRTGEAVRAPALAPALCWRVEQRSGKVFVTGKLPQPKPILRSRKGEEPPARVVIVGGGAAGFAAAEMLRRRGFERDITIVSDDSAAPVDRPNLSKDYLAGNAPEDWVPLRPDGFYQKNNIDLQLETNVVAFDTGRREVLLSSGGTIPYDRLLLATGAEPVRLPIPGADLPHVFTLRSLADCRAIIKAAETARRAVIVGASFIGLEVAASLRARKLDVHVIAPERRPMEKVFGPQLGDFIRTLHEEHGVVFHLEQTASAIESRRVLLKNGAAIEGDIVIVGIGVRPRTAIAEKAGINTDRGVVVDAFLETSAPGVFAAGDIARWPDRYSGERIRVEHWVVAERQGQAAAANMLGLRQPYTDVPFFWSQHYDVPINYVGHAEKWDEIEIDGDIARKDCLLRYRQDGRMLAVASIYRDLDNLQAELQMEQEVARPR
jgi:NADPH-dependent 2,4-dienoyl-CoA reductase/sulfur reductase-like enzyme/nitrite reductase/ring-hydroxylating ferredoxin subunit